MYFIFITLEDRVIIANTPFLQAGWRLEKLSNLSRVTQLVNYKSKSLKAKAQALKHSAHAGFWELFLMWFIILLFLAWKQLEQCQFWNVLRQNTSEGLFQQTPRKQFSFLFVMSLTRGTLWLPWTRGVQRLGWHCCRDTLCSQARLGILLFSVRTNCIVPGELTAHFSLE